MTLRQLKRLGDLYPAIDYQLFKLERLRARLNIKSPRLDGIPGGAGPRDLIGDLMPDLIESEEDVILEIRRLLAEMNEIERWIHGFNDLKFELVCMLRFKEKRSWRQITDDLSSSSAEPLGDDAIRMYLNRQLRRYGVEGLDDGRI